RAHQVPRAGIIADVKSERHPASGWRPLNTAQRRVRAELLRAGLRAERAGRGAGLATFFVAVFARGRVRVPGFLAAVFARVRARVVAFVAGGFFAVAFSAAAFFAVAFFAVAFFAVA